MGAIFHENGGNATITTLTVIELQCAKHLTYIILYV